MNKMHVLVMGLVLTAIPLFSQSTFISRFCFDNFNIPSLEYRLEKIPIGCEVIDCCPGCPGPGFSDQFKVVYELKGSAVGSFALDIKNSRGLKFGEAHVKSGKVTLKNNNNILTGINPVANNPTLITPVFRLNESDIRKLQSKWKPTLEASPDSAIEEVYTLKVTQTLGNVILRVSEYSFHLKLCFRKPDQDKIKLLDNAGNDISFIVSDGRRSGTATCIDDQLANSAATASVGGNMLVKNTCHDDIVVFSLDDAMGLNEAPNWTNTNGETRNVTLGTPYVMTLNIYIMNGIFNTTRTRAQNDVARANQLYNSSRCGIQFEANYINATADPEAAGLLNEDCGSSDAFRTNIGFTNNTLNIYYNGDPGARGWECGGPPTNIILVASYATNETLAHEIGHALTLNHTNALNNDGIPGNDFPATNVMFGGGINRDSFTEGQCFRCNILANSSLNAYGVRTGPTRTCNDAARTGECLPHELDM